MTTTTKIKSITVMERLRQDKVNGNTYNTTQRIMNGVTVGKTIFQYGYGDFYIQAAGDWLEKNGYIKREHYPHGGATPLWSYCSDNGIHCEYQSAYYKKREC